MVKNKYNVFVAIMQCNM